MHTSTSAAVRHHRQSCDVAASMMEPPGGTALVEESIKRVAGLPPRHAQGRRRNTATTGGSRSGGRTALVEDGIGKLAGLDAGHRRTKWHGFGPLARRLQPAGPDQEHHHHARVWTCSGKFAAKTGIPAGVVTKFLAEHGVVVEKTGLYSFFIMFTIGITKGRWNTMLTALQQFKDDYDRNAADVAHPAGVHRQAHPHVRAHGFEATCARPSTRPMPRATSQG